jgi:hypothetical protein
MNDVTFVFAIFAISITHMRDQLCRYTLSGSNVKLVLRTRFSFFEHLCMLVSVCFHNLVTYTLRLHDLYRACFDVLNVYTDWT